METIEYTPAQASALANLPLPAVHKLIERRLIRPRRLRIGRSIQRMLSREQVLYLRLEAEGVRLLPIAARRAIAKKIESSPGIDAVVLMEGSALLIQVKSVRLELDEELKKLERAANIVISDPEIMRGTPVYRGTRIPVELIALEFVDQLPGGVEVHQVVVAEFLAVELRGAGDSLAGPPVERRGLMGILAVAEVHQLGRADGEGARQGTGGSHAA